MNFAKNDILSDMLVSFKAGERQLIEYLGTCSNHELQGIGYKIRNELEYTFSRYTDLKGHKLPQPFCSVFAIGYNYLNQFKENKNLVKNQEIEQKKEYAPIPIKKEEKTKPIPNEIFSIFDDNSDTKPTQSVNQINLSELEKSNEIQEIIHSPIKPTKSPEAKKDQPIDPLTKLNEIMAKMALEEQEKKHQQDLENKKISDPVAAAFPSAPMQYATGWPYPSPMPNYMGYQMNPYMNMNPYMTGVNPNLYMRPMPNMVSSPPTTSSPLPNFQQKNAEKTTAKPVKEEQGKDQFSELFNMADAKLSMKQESKNQKGAEMLFEDIGKTSVPETKKQNQNQKSIFLFKNENIDDLLDLW